MVGLTKKGKLLIKRNAMQPHQIFLRGLHETFNKARLQSDVVERYFKVGPYIVSMRFAGIVLANKMTPALEHLITAPAKNPSLNIFLWEGNTAQFKSIPWVNHFHKKNQPHSINILNTKTMYTTYNPLKQTLNVYDEDSHTAFFWVPDARKIHSDELTSPLQNILHKFLMPKDMFLVHAGAVGIPSGGILLAGKGGSGKSTSVLSCLNSPLLYAADNCTLITEGLNTTVFSLYSSARIHGESLWRVPEVTSSVVNAHNLEHEKALIFLNRMNPGKLILQFPLRAIFLPHITGKLDTSLSPATPRDAINALLLSTVALLPQTDPHTVQKLIAIIQNVPAYHLNLGTRMEQIPRVIAQFLGKS
ncbi:MAG: hypothetical protein ACM3IJ_05890 [Candidatus Levyibacteriota bacterium]